MKTQVLFMNNSVSNVARYLDTPIHICQGPTERGANLFGGIRSADACWPGLMHKCADRVEKWRGKKEKTQ
jgi:hypothetical protein